MTCRIAVIPGDGIGPEAAGQVTPLLDVMRELGTDLEWVAFPFCADHFLATGETLPDATFVELRDTFDGILFGAVGDPRVPDYRHAEGILLRLRRDLELGMNFRPCRPLLDAFVPLRDVPARAIHIDVFRENTEGPYCLEGETRDDRAVDLSIHTPAAVGRLLESAFAGASERGCRLTLAHKANVLKHGHGVWMRTFKALSEAHPGLETESIHADALLCRLVQDPARFGVIAADNFLGDLISDMLAAYQGGMGMAPSISWASHRPYRCRALAEPVHGSAPDLAGRDAANPCGMFLSLALLLRQLGLHDQGAAIESAVEAALQAGWRTADLGGTATGSSLGAAVRRHFEP